MLRVLTPQGLCYIDVFHITVGATIGVGLMVLMRTVMKRTEEDR